MAKINLYLVPNHTNPKKGGGTFLSVYKNEGPKLDLTDILYLEDQGILGDYVRKVTGDESFKRIGGIITPMGEQIESANVYNDLSGKDETPSERSNYEELLLSVGEINRQIQMVNSRLLEGLMRSQGEPVKVLKIQHPSSDKEN